VVSVNIDKLEEFRKLSGLTKSALSKMVGIHPSTYRLILKGEIASPPTIKRLALAVGLDPKKAWKKGRNSG